MAMSMFNARRQIDNFEQIRGEWLEILNKNPNNSDAAQHIVSINAKLELLRILGHSEILEEEDND